ncbi:ABC transporter substrate-binding protein [Mycobacterium avium subsp. hominissuis]|uniref:ABC transporter substrate-binding protein n=1 Tax=Mycobacterium avium TaxID=1764 RepID=UPI00293B28EB|nr:ABC transporter substrate-binding protein [Mycobacterium avium]MDV3249028.1 ABC transporter substrate-binding protein [Mycobacterium avium subsp. hominissuis]MDV3274673.1 ABC transporter substrate-binding protein [Mycobacterium avium subsp. hominissuis]MDV3322283.1 ABC transporter substrate-binding protein [Mycobacterium avium subsp. hominissuis]
MSVRKLLRYAAALALALTAVLTGCGHSPSTSSSATATTLRLGYLTRVSHASALVGIEKGIFARDVGPAVKLDVRPFGQGTEEATALLSDQIDAAYVGPNPAFNAWQKSGGTAIKIISGSAAGGTSLVVKPGIAGAQDLRGKTVADPALGGNQDVSLRSWLKQNGLQTNPQGGGDVFIKPTKPESAIVQEFATNQIDGAIESAPYDVQLIKAGGVRLWRDPNTITVLVVRQSFLRAHPDAVLGLLRGQVEANELIHSSPDVAAQAANATLTRALGKGLDADVLSASFGETTFTNDPNSASLKDQVNKAVSVGLLDPLNLDGIFELGPLNDVLKSSGKPAVDS